MPLQARTRDRRWLDRCWKARSREGLTAGRARESAELRHGTIRHAALRGETKPGYTTGRMSRRIQFVCVFGEKRSEWWSQEGCISCAYRGRRWVDCARVRWGKAGRRLVGPLVLGCQPSVSTILGRRRLRRGRLSHPTGRRVGEAIFTAPERVICQYSNFIT
jgi:hypothetical protein